MARDGKPIKHLSVLRRMMPTLFPTRNECVVYFEQQLDLTKTLAWLDANEDRTNFFKLAIAGLVRVWSERPQLNRFVAGGKLYQRDDIAFGMSVKMEFTDKSPIRAVKALFEPTDSIEDVAAKVDALVQVGRDEHATSSEKEMSIVTKLPILLMRLLVKLQRALDWLGLLPKFMTRDDPLYASAFVANLGSLRLDAAYHHLYEYGTIPFFIVIGKIKKAPVVDENGELSVRDTVTFRYSFDERITDAFYCAESLERFRAYIEDPSLLESVQQHFAPSAL